MTTTTLIAHIVEVAKNQGLTQKELAALVGISHENLSRLKRGGNPGLAMVERLAKFAGLRLRLEAGGSENADTASSTTVLTKPSNSAELGSQQTLSGPPHTATADAFRAKYRTLIWSNPKADESILIRKALLSSRFATLLDAAHAFGLDRLAREWEMMLKADDAEVKRIRPQTQRILNNIQYGYDQAAS